MKNSGNIPFEFPTAHEAYILMRDQYFYTVTPCYGLHSPWWVVKTADGKEADPVPMADGDRWWNIGLFNEALKGW